MKFLPQTAIVAAALLLIVSGCTTRTEIFDPTDTARNTTRAIGTVSYPEYYEAARAAAHDAMCSPAFEQYLNRYRVEQGDAGAIPLMQVGYLKNQTNDPELRMNLVTDELCTALMNSGKVSVTLATGRDRSATFSEARELARDDNFDRSTVAPKGTLEAPVLSLEGAVISNVVRDGRETVQVYSFNLKLAEIRTGRVIWSCNTPFGTKKTTGSFGW